MGENLRLEILPSRMADALCIEDSVPPWVVPAPKEAILGDHALFGPSGLIILQDFVHDIGMIEDVIVPGGNNLSSLSVGGGRPVVD